MARRRARQPHRRHLARPERAQCCRESFTYNDRLERLGRFDFLPHFARELAAMGVATRDDLAWALLNDGDAEAFGNHALRALKGWDGRGEDLREARHVAGRGTRDRGRRGCGRRRGFSKVAINLTAPTLNDQPGWLARHYISAEGVRSLSRMSSEGRSSSARASPPSLAAPPAGW